ncbi:beta-lactamase family protein [Candidatus Dependentiae bacterium]|nr:beta-lactamase family protein [Candidatus Dependentiae bacterium]
MMKFLKKIWLISFIIPSANAQFSAQKIAPIHEHISNLAAQNEFSGIVLITDEEGRVIFNQGYGYADHLNKLPHTDQTKYALCSVSKQFTAMIILILDQEGKLSVHDPIQKYLPEFMHTQVTIYQLLTHTSGLPRDFYDPKIYVPDAITNAPYLLDWSKQLGWKILDDVMPLHYALQLESTPGEKFCYSNAGYNLLSKIIEVVDNQSYSESLQRRIFNSLEMTNSRGTTIHEELAQEQHGSGVLSFRFADILGESLGLGDGTIVSTAQDLLKWHLALTKSLLLDKEHYELMWKPNLENYACGWEISKVCMGDREEKTIGHNGAWNYFSTNIIRFADSKACIIALATSGPWSTDFVTKIIATQMIGNGDEVYPYRIKPMNVPFEDMKQFEGTYENIVEGEKKCWEIVASEQGSLLVYPKGEGLCIQILPSSPYEWFSNVTDLVCIFERNEDEKVHQIQVKSTDDTFILLKQNIS